MKSNLAIIKVQRGVWDVVAPSGKVIFTGTKKEIRKEMKTK
jgi:hypothetical protein